MTCVFSGTLSSYVRIVTLRPTAMPLLAVGSADSIPAVPTAPERDIIWCPKRSTCLFWSTGGDVDQFNQSLAAQLGSKQCFQERIP